MRKRDNKDLDTDNIQENLERDTKRGKKTIAVDFYDFLTGELEGTKYYEIDILDTIKVSKKGGHAKGTKIRKPKSINPIQELINSRY